MEQLKIWYFMGQSVSEDPVRTKTYKSYAKYIEDSINSSGGIGGLNARIYCEKHTSMSFDIEDQFENFSNSILKLHPQPSILLGLPSAFFKYKPDFMKKFDGLVFTSIDPTIEFFSNRVFNLEPNLFDKRKLLNFMASNINPKNIFLCQAYYFNDKSIDDLYQNSLKDSGWKGNFKIFRLKKDEERFLEEWEFNEIDRNELENKKRYNRLYKQIEIEIVKLPKNSLLVANCHYPVTLAKIIYDKDLDLHVIDGIGYYPYESYIATPMVADIEHLKKIENYCKKNNLTNETHVEDVQKISSDLLPLFVCQKAANFAGDKYEEPKEAVQKLAEAIGLLDGKKDVFLMDGQILAFKNNQNIGLNPTLVYKNRFIDQINRYEKLLYEKQPSNEQIKGKDVIYSFLDLQRIENIDVSAGNWTVEFELEINSPFNDPIKNLKFPNRSEIKNTWSVYLIREKMVTNRFQCKYKVVGTFDFTPDIREFPYDKQTLTIDLGLEKNIENCILQPPLDSLVDKDFEINGWKLLEARSGVFSSKNFDRVGTDLDTKVNVETINRTEWILARSDNVSVLRSLIPLLVLILLSWYSSFNTADQALNTIQLNTTVFLAGVALYFSAEKPSGSKFTFIDRMFIYFYLAIGTLILTEFSVILSVKLYEYTHTVWQVAIPILLTLLLYNYWKKNTSIKRFTRKN